MLIDMHHHLIYGIDDGAKSFEGTEKMIRDAVKNQIAVIVTTPHITPGQEPFPYDAYKARLEETRRYLKEKGIPLRLYTGAEILYTPNTCYMLMDGKVPTMAGTQYVLVEFSPDDPYQHIADALKNISAAGYIPIIAHAERYDCLKKPDQLRRLRRDCNALVQMNAKTVIRKHRFFRERYIRRILEEGLVDFISSDSHDMPGRSNHMLEAYERLAEDLGEARARKLAFGNADRFLRQSSQYQADKDEESEQ